MREVTKQDVPEVEAVVAAIEPLMDRFWGRKLGQIIRYLEDTLRGYPRALGRDAVDTLVLVQDLEAAIERELEVLLAALRDRASCPLPAEGATAVEEAADELLTAGAAAIGLLSPVDVRSRVLARLELQSVILGRLISQAAELKGLLRQYLTDRELRAGFELRGTGTLSVGDAWRQQVLEILGSRWQTWGPQTVDAWAYRRYNLGTFLAGERAGVTEWIAVNPLDNLTTRFCRWVHGRTVAVGRIRGQLEQLEIAVLEGDLEALMDIWPLDAPQSGDPRDNRRNFARMGLPPYHFRCRTVIRPANQ